MHSRTYSPHVLHVLFGILLLRKFSQLGNFGENVAEIIFYKPVACAAESFPAKMRTIAVRLNNLFVCSAPAKFCTFVPLCTFYVISAEITTTKTLAFCHIIPLEYSCCLNQFIFLHLIDVDILYYTCWE